MPSRTRLALAVGGGYLLGRTKKLKLALSVGSLVAGRRASGPDGLVAATLDAVRKNPEFDALREQLMGAGRTAAISAATRGLERTTQRISLGVDKVAGTGASTGGSEQDEPDEPEQPQDEQDQEQEPRGESEQDERGESDEPDEDEDERGRSAQDKGGQNGKQRRFEAPGGKQRYRPRDDEPESAEEPKQRPAARKSKSPSNGGSQSNGSRSNGSGGDRPTRRRAERPTAPARQGGRNG